MTGLNITASSGGVTLTNTAYNPVTIAGGVSVTNSSGPALESNLATYWTIGNSGTLEATGTAAGSDGIVLAAGGAITNTLAGRISGYAAGVSLAGSGTLVNQGSIASGQTAGIGYSYTGDVFTALSAGVIMGGGGVSNASTAVIGSYFEGVAVGGGGSVVNAGSIIAHSTADGFGVVLTAGGSVSNASGGTIVGSVDAVLAFGASTVANQGFLDGQTNIGVVLAGGGTVSNAAAGTITSTLVGIETFGTFANAVTNAAGATISGGRYALFGRGDSFTLVNAGIMAGVSAVGVALLVPSTVSNATSGTISGDYIGLYTGGAAGSTITNAGEVVGIEKKGVWLAAGGVLTNDLSGRISGGYDAIYADGTVASTITNQGTLVGTTVAGVWLAAGGGVTNDLNGTISGQIYGVRVTSAAGTVVNAGSISDSQLFSGAGVQLAAGGVVTNSAQGDISSTWIGVQIGASTTTSVGGTVVNQGTIFASDGTNGAAIWIHGPGSIYNTPSGTIEGGPYAIVAYYQTTVLNQGSIGGTEFAFDAVNPGFADRIIDTPGAVFSGLVSGGNTLGSTVSSTLELASSTGTGTISGLGVQFVDFGQVTIDAGADWMLTTLTGGNTLGAGGTLTNSGTLALGSTGLSDAGLLVNGGTIVLGGATVSAPGSFSSTGHISGFGTLIGQLTNSGTVTASGGTLAVTGSITGTGELQIANNARLLLDAAPAAGQSVSFGAGAELILNAPGTAFGNAITGLDTGDTIEFGNGMTITSASVVNGDTIAVDFHGSGGLSGTYDLTDVGFATGSDQQFSVGADASTGDSYVQVGTATLTALVDFNAANGAYPGGALIADSSGDLFGTTASGGADGDGTVFEIAKTGGTYASTPATLVSFNNADGNDPLAALIADAAGNLLGTTFSGGADGIGTVFEIARTDGTYASTPTTLVNFNSTDGQQPVGSLIEDAAGDLFGTTTGGGGVYGTVFEIPYVDGSYASTPDKLVSFDGTDGQSPVAGLIADAAGDLFGTTGDGGTSGGGTVFEIANTSSGYASTPVALVSFNGTDGAGPDGGVVADAAGDLFGTTNSGGAYNDGTVFEITKTGSSYASTPITLVSFNGTDGSLELGSLIVDADGNLFGTTSNGGAYDDGTVFEIANTSTGYASTPTTLVSFDYTEGINPNAGLIADAAGDLFGTTSAGGPDGAGTVFELTDTGFQVAASESWLTDVPGDFDDATKWSDGVVPGAGTAATIDFADDPQVTHDTGADTVQSLTNTAGDFVMSGGVLSAVTLTNASQMSWTGGSLILDTGTAGLGSLDNTATGTLTIAPNGQSLTTTGSGTASFTNAGTITAAFGTGVAAIDAPLTNTGEIIVNQGTLALNGGGSTNADLLQGGILGTLQFGASPGGGTPTFTITNGEYAVDNTAITGAAVDMSAVAGGIFFVNNLSLSAGSLTLGSQSAAAQNTLNQSGGTLFDAALFTVYGGANLVGGVQSGSGTTALFGVSTLGGGFALDGGRTLENHGWLNWSAGTIALGSGDPSAVDQAGTLSNIATATFYITAADGRISNGGSGVVDNAGVMAVFAGVGAVQIDAALDNVGADGFTQIQSGTLSLNGGGSSNAGQFYAAPGATLQFGAPLSGPAGTFVLTGGAYGGIDTIIDGGTLDASAAGAVFFGQLQMTGSGALLLGGLDAQANTGMQQSAAGDGSGPVLSGTGSFLVFGGANLTGGVQTGGGDTQLYGVSTIGGSFAIDGGRTLLNYGWLNWNAGDIALGSGDPNAVVAAGTLSNAAGATFYVTASGGRITSTGGVLDNAGVMAVFAGTGEVDVDATVDNTGFIQALSGTLGLNGGGSSNGYDLVVGSDAVLRFGAAQGSAGGGTFSVTGGSYYAPVTEIAGSTLDLSGAAAATFGSLLAISSGELTLGGAYGYADTLELTGGTLSFGVQFTVGNLATLGSGLITGSGGALVLDGQATIGGALQVDGGRVVQNDGTLVWSGGTLTLGGGDATLSTHSATLSNVAGAVLAIEGDGTVGTAGSGMFFNAGTIEKSAGLGVTTVSVGMSNTGTVDVSSGTLVFGQAVSGAGTFVLEGTAVLDLVDGAGSGSAMQFLQPGGTLETAALGSFASVISGFAAGDEIDAAAVGFVTGTTSVGFSGGTLTVSNGAQSAAFVLSGSYAAAGFAIGSDGHGGTGVTFV